MVKYLQQWMKNKITEQEVFAARGLNHLYEDDYTLFLLA